MVDVPTLEMPVADRIRYFESRRSSNVYVVGHGICLSVQADVSRTSSKGKVVEGTKDVAIDTGGAGGTLKPVAYKLNKRGRLAIRNDESEYKFEVPLGMSIRFYCKHGEHLTDRIANLIEGFTKGVDPARYVKEVIPAGSYCYNYRLGAPRGLTLHLSQLQARHDVIMLYENRQFAWVPLSTILRDPRCENATIHWLACRSMSGRALNKKNESVEHQAKVMDYFKYVGGQPVISNKPVGNYMGSGRLHAENEWD